MLIPLAMIRSQINDRQFAATNSQDEVAASWGRRQILSGPVLNLTYDTERMVDDQKKETTRETGTIYPQDLSYDIDLSTQTLHRSIYDIMVYVADVTVQGNFVVPASYGEKDLQDQAVTMGLSDLRGIDGPVVITLGDQDYSFHSGSAGKYDDWATLMESINLETAMMDGKTALPFKATYRVRWSSSLMVRPYGGTTEVKMRSNCPDPSFT